MNFLQGKKKKVLPLTQGHLPDTFGHCPEESQPAMGCPCSTEVAESPQEEPSTGLRQTNLGSHGGIPPGPVGQEVR